MGLCAGTRLERPVVEQHIPGTAKAMCLPLAVTPSPRAAMRTIGSLIRRCGGGATRSSAIIPGRRLAARPCAQTAAQAASNASGHGPECGDDARQTSPVPALASHAGARSEAEPAIRGRNQRIRPLVDITDCDRRPPPAPIGLAAQYRRTASQTLPHGCQDRVMTAQTFGPRSILSRRRRSRWPRRGHASVISAALRQARPTGCSRCGGRDTAFRSGQWDGSPSIERMC